MVHAGTQIHHVFLIVRYAHIQDYDVTTSSQVNFSFAYMVRVCAVRFRSCVRSVILPQSVRQILNEYNEYNGRKIRCNWH